MSTPAGRLDLFCRDARGDYVVVELKRTQGTDQVVGQLLRYMGWAQEKYRGNNVRGIIIILRKDDVPRKDDALRYALKATLNVEVKEKNIDRLTVGWKSEAPSTLHPEVEGA